MQIEILLEYDNIGRASEGVPSARDSNRSIWLRRFHAPKNALPLPGIIKTSRGARPCHRTDGKHLRRS